MPHGGQRCNGPTRCWCWNARPSSVSELLPIRYGRMQQSAFAVLPRPAQWPSYPPTCRTLQQVAPSSAVTPTCSTSGCSSRRSAPCSAQRLRRDLPGPIEWDVGAYFPRRGDRRAGPARRTRTAGGGGGDGPVYRPMLTVRPCSEPRRGCASRHRNQSLELADRASQREVKRRIAGARRDHLAFGRLVEECDGQLFSPGAPLLVQWRRAARERRPAGAVLRRGGRSFLHQYASLPPDPPRCWSVLPLPPRHHPEGQSASAASAPARSCCSASLAW